MKTKLHLLAKVVLFAVVLVCATSGVAQTTDERLTRAFESIKKKDYESAIADINEVLKTQPKEPNAFYYRGAINFALGKYDEAIADYTKAIDINTSRPSPQFYYERGNAYMYKSSPDNKSALADFNHVLEIAPDYKKAYDQRGDLNITLQNWAAAESDYTHVIALDPHSSANIYVNRGVANTNLKRYAEAILDYRQALGIDASNPVAKKNLDITLALQKQTSAQSGAVSSQKGRSGLTYDQLINRELASVDKSDYKSALNDVNEAIGLDPRNKMGYLARGRVYYELRDFDKTIDDETKALSYDPEGIISKSAFYLRGIAYQSKQPADYSAAIADFSRAIQLDNTYYDAFYNRGYCYQQLKQWHAADDDYVRAGIWKKGALYFLHYSVVTLNYRGLEWAIPVAYKAVEAEPTNAEAIKNYKTMLDRMPESDRLAKIETVRAEHNKSHERMDIINAKVPTSHTTACNRYLEGANELLKDAALLHDIIPFVRDDKEKEKFRDLSEQVNKEYDLAWSLYTGNGCG